MRTRPSTSILIGLSLAACDRPAPPAPASTANAVAPAPPPLESAPATAPTAAPSSDAVTFDADSLGAPSPSFEGVVGDWYVAEASGARGLEVDGSKWRSGEPSANLADQAKRLYGDRYAEFLDGVKTFAFFPLAVWKGRAPQGDFRASMRFFPMAGKIDQAAGIAFAIAADGSYLGARANALEDNLLFFRVVKGKRTIIDTIRGVSTPSKASHTFAIELRGKQLTVELDGRKRFDKTLDGAPGGRIGLWSKADSQVLFDDFSVTEPRKEP
jgi:hypothetical protein